MKKPFGVRSDGQQAYLYTIRGGGLTAEISDHGATLVKLFVPDRQGRVEDVVLGFDSPDEYTQSTTYFGCTVGRSCNRIGGARFRLNGREVRVDANDNGVNNLHGGFDAFKNRLWEVTEHTENALTLFLLSPHGDHGMPGNVRIHVTYALEPQGNLRISYRAVSDQDTVINLTNHSFFNLAGHRFPEKAMDQILSMPARHFTVVDELSIPTGELRSVEGTPFDFRVPKAIGRDLGTLTPEMAAQGGYDHNFEAYCNPCVTLKDEESGRVMCIYSDRPGIQFYGGNYLCGDRGKDGVTYCFRGGIALETQCYPDSVNHPEWVQPFVKAGEVWRSETTYCFTCE